MSLLPLDLITVFFFNHCFSFFCLYSGLLFLLGYIHYKEGFIVTIPIRFILYISYIAPIVSPLQSPPHPSHCFLLSCMLFLSDTEKGE
jgi:hypothetical protein